MRMNLFSNVSFTPSKEKDSALTAPWGVCYSRANRPANIGANRNANHLLTQMLTRLAASSTNHFAIATLIAL
jgi:hypothetical protein